MENETKNNEKLIKTLDALAMARASATQIDNRDHARKVFDTLRRMGDKIAEQFRFAAVRKSASASHRKS